MSEDKTIEIAYTCPVCDWAVSKDTIEQARIDYDCPGCGTRKLSEFEQYGIAL